MHDEDFPGRANQKQLRSGDHGRSFPQAGIWIGPELVTNPHRLFGWSSPRFPWLPVICKKKTQKNPRGTARLIVAGNSGNGDAIWDNGVLARNAAVSRNQISGFSLMGAAAVRTQLAAFSSLNLRSSATFSSLLIGEFG